MLSGQAQHTVHAQDTQHMTCAQRRAGKELKPGPPEHGCRHAAVQGRSRCRHDVLSGNPTRECAALAQQTAVCASSGAPEEIHAFQEALLLRHGAHAEGCQRQHAESLGRFLGGGRLAHGRQHRRT